MKMKIFNTRLYIIADVIEAAVKEVNSFYMPKGHLESNLVNKVFSDTWIQESIAINGISWENIGGKGSPHSLIQHGFGSHTFRS